MSQLNTREFGPELTKSSTLTPVVQTGDVGVHVINPVIN